MAIDTKLFDVAIEEFKQHLHAARELIGDEVTNHIIGQLSSAHALDEYLGKVICEVGLPTLRHTGQDLADSHVVGINSRNKVEAWMQLDALHQEWQQLVRRTGGLAPFSFTYSDYMKRTRAHQRPH